MRAPPGQAADAASVSLRDNLVGTWRLVSWESVGEDGGVELPMGEAPEGLLIYTAGGTMITTIGRSARAHIPGDDWLAGTADERLAAMGSFIAYGGTYEVEGQDVVHTVLLSLFPNWVGSRQRRHVVLDEGGARLTLTADPFLFRGRVSSQRLVWARA